MYVVLLYLVLLYGVPFVPKYKEGHMYKCEGTFTNVRLHLYM